MKTRHILLLTAFAVPLVVGLAHAQPRLKDCVTPAPGFGSATPPATGAAPAPPAPPAGTTPPGGTAAPGGTGTPGTGVPAAGNLKGPGGKSPSDTTALTQFENALEFEPRSPNYRVAFSLEDADLAELVRVIAQLTGKRFIFGGKVKNIKATVYSPQKVTVAEAYQAFLSILETNGLTVVPHGRFLKIVETNAVATQGTPIYGASQGAPAEDRFVTRMHRLGHISADDAANVLGKFKSKEADITVYGPGNMIILTDSGTNIRRMMQILEEIDVGSSGDQIFIEPIHYASASDIEKRINELFDVKSGGAGGAPSSPKAGGGSTTSISPSIGDLHVAKIVADDRSNSLVIVATERAYLRILELIKRIDVPQTGEGEIHVLPLQHADATELTKTLTDIITGTTTPAPGGGGRGAPAPAPSQQAAGIFEGGVKVSADKATNAIVITASLRDFASLRLVIDRLDLPRRQVFIEAVIMDLQLKRSDSFGVSFHGGAPFQFDNPNDSLVFGGNKITNTIPPVPADPDALQGFALGVRGPGISGSQNFLGTGISVPAFGTFIQALARTGDSDLLSTPHILALDNEDAEINVGDNIPLQTNAVSSFPGAAGAAGAAGALGALGGLGGFGSVGSPRQDVGTKIKIKPHLNDSNEVRLDVSEEISEQGAPLGGTLGAIPISKRTATTKLVVQDQQTVVIGGLIRNVTSRAEEKVPVLGDIPVLGALFRKRINKKQEQSETLQCVPIGASRITAIEKDLFFDGKKLVYEYYKNLNQKDLVREIFSFLRNNGFPYPKWDKNDLINDFNQIKNLDISRIEFENIIDTQINCGNKLFKHYNEHFFNVKDAKLRNSYVESYNDDKILEKVIKNRIDGQFNITMPMIIQGLRNSYSCFPASIFHASTAKFIYDTYCKNNDVILDFSSGFGQRLMGAMASKHNVKYIGIDPLKENIDGSNNIISFIKDNKLSNNNAEMHCIGAENINYNNEINLAFSSPPYFNKEIYKNENTQCYHNRSLDSFLNDWWSMVVKKIHIALKNDGLFLLNIDTWLSKSMVDICFQNGFELSGQHLLKLSKNTSFRGRENIKYEPIFVFKKVI